MRQSGVLLVAACLALTGCGGGGGGSNDNGISVRFSGVFQETQEQVAPAADRLPDATTAIADTGTTIILGVDNSVPKDRNGDGDLDGGFLGIQNNLDQSINVTQVSVQIFIAGAKLNNPVATDVVPLAVSLPPASINDQNVRTPSVAFDQTIFVSPDILAFLARNQNLLPPLPFNMNVEMRITAVSDSGDTFETNEVTYPVLVIAPTA